MISDTNQNRGPCAMMSYHFNRRVGSRELEPEWRVDLRLITDLLIWLGVSAHAGTKATIVWSGRCGVGGWRRRHRHTPQGKEVRRQFYAQCREDRGVAASEWRYTTAQALPLIKPTSVAGWLGLSFLVQRFFYETATHGTLSYSLLGSIL